MDSPAARANRPLRAVNLPPLQAVAAARAELDLLWHGGASRQAWTGLQPRRVNQAPAAKARASAANTISTTRRLACGETAGCSGALWAAVSVALGGSAPSLMAVSSGVSVGARFLRVASTVATAWSLAGVAVSSPPAGAKWLTGLTPKGALGVPVGRTALAAKFSMVPSGVDVASAATLGAANVVTAPPWAVRSLGAEALRVLVVRSRATATTNSRVHSAAASRKTGNKGPRRA